jgi:hypothetical protein
MSCLQIIIFGFDALSATLLYRTNLVRSEIAIAKVTFALLLVHVAVAFVGDFEVDFHLGQLILRCCTVCISFNLL